MLVHVELQPMLGYYSLKQGCPFSIGRHQEILGQSQTGLATMIDDVSALPRDIRRWSGESEDSLPQGNYMTDSQRRTQKGCVNSSPEI